jgi:hypothetical protein
MKSVLDIIMEMQFILWKSEKEIQWNIFAIEINLFNQRFIGNYNKNKKFKRNVLISRQFNVLLPSAQRKTFPTKVDSLINF